MVSRSSKYSNMVRVKAFSLVETIISLVIVMFSIGVAFIIFMQVSIPQLTDAEAYFIVESELNKLSISKEKLVDYSVSLEKYDIEVEVINFEQEPLVQVQVVLNSKEGKQIYAKKKLLVQP